MKKIKQKIFGIFASIYFLISIMPHVHAKKHRILVVPSRGALGKISVAFLVELEKKTGKQIHEPFTE